MSSNQQGGVSDGFGATTGVSQIISIVKACQGDVFSGLRHCCRKMPKPIHVVPLVVWPGCKS